MTPRTIYEAPRVDPREGETVVTSTCGHNCGGRCVVNAHVVDDRVVKISTDPARWQPELPPLHACARGVGQIERLYHKDRLKYPMRRTGPRGSGQFERISWDEALDHVAKEMRRIREAYGNAAFLDASRSGNTSALHGFRRFLAWRRQHPLLITGDIEFLAATDSVLAFRRFDKTDGMLVAFNLSHAPASVALPGLPLGHQLAGHGLPEGSFASATLSLPGHGVAFFQLTAR